MAKRGSSKSVVGSAPVAEAPVSPTVASESTVTVNGASVGLPAFVQVKLPQAEAQKMGVIPAEGREAPRYPEGTKFEPVVRDGKITLVPKGSVSVEALAETPTKPQPPIQAHQQSPLAAVAQSMGVEVVDVDAVPTETVTLTLPRAQMDALKWLARSERQGVVDWLYNTARRTVNQPLWNALVEGRPEDELLALKVSDGRVALRPAPSPGEEIELAKMSDKEQIYYELITLPHDPRHPCAHCRKGNPGGRAAGDGRICANMQHTLSAPCHWPPQSLSGNASGGGCPGFAPKADRGPQSGRGR